jgi:hypothetical protein
MTNHRARREVLAGLGAAALLGSTRIQAAPKKAMEGAFVITATPYTETKAVAFEDLAAEVDFLDRCGVQGMVWPQSASEYTELTEDERMQGMEVLGKKGPRQEAGTRPGRASRR